MSAKPLCVDLYAGLGGWAEGALSAGYEVVGFDNGHTAPYATGARYPSPLCGREFQAEIVTVGRIYTAFVLSEPISTLIPERSGPLC